MHVLIFFHNSFHIQHDLHKWFKTKSAFLFYSQHCLVLSISADANFVDAIEWIVYNAQVKMWHTGGAVHYEDGAHTLF